MFESSSKNRKSWNRRQMVWQCIPNIWNNRWKWFGSCHGGFTWRNAYWKRQRRVECSRRHISWDERWKMGWLRDWPRDRRVAGSIPETTNLAFWLIALDKLQIPMCSCLPSSMNWNQLAGGETLWALLPRSLTQDSISCLKGCMHSWNILKKLMSKICPA